MITALFKTELPIVFYDGPIYWWERVLAFLLSVELVELRKADK